MKSNAGCTVRIKPFTPHHADACETIARKLPAWFGIEEGLLELRRALDRGPGLLAISNGMVTGFVTLDTPFPETREITWMAVDPAHHRCGTGRALMEAVERDARAAGVRLLHVKTLADRHPSPEYAQTRAFYRALGFERLAVIPELWDPVNPCLLMVKPL